MNEVTPNPAETVVETTEVTGTEQKETVTTEHLDGVDYRQKFIESSKGAMALLDENKKLKEELAVKTAISTTPPTGKTDGLTTPPSQDTDVLYPGFEELDPEAQANLIAYSNGLLNKAKQEMYQDPAIAFARKTYNETKWDTAFATVTAKFPELASAKDEFKSQYYNSNNVPDNITDILEVMAKNYLFDKARDIGRREGEEVAQRVQLEEPTGGDKTPTAHRSLADWQRMAQTNPAKFAQLRQEFEADMAKGKLQE